jgi:signal transduction histidine kinase
VAEVVEHYRQAAPGHPIAVSLPPGAVPVRCDPLRIEQVVSNLVGNAIKYSPNGTPVEVAVTDDGGRATVTVTDQGVGVAPEDRPHLFEPFRRGSRARGIAGLGLGLAVARRIVEAHGGRIELDSVATAGSTFHLILPIASGPPA